MNWIVFSYSLPSKARSSHRVAIWRRLKRLGAIALNSGVYVLPNKEDCVEGFQWLAQEVREGKGDSMVMKVEKFEGVSDHRIIDFFQKASKIEYEKLSEKFIKLEKDFKRQGQIKQSKNVQNELRDLENQFSEIVKVDFFQSPYGKNMMNRLKKIQEKFVSPPSVQNLPKYSLDDYKNKKWVTRPRSHVDRLSSIWLIRKFISPNAKIRYADEPKPNEIPFDMKDVLFGHHQNLCTFETFLAVFNLKNPTLKIMSEIIHEIDLKDGQYFHPQTQGIATILDGLRHTGLSNEKLESHGVILFEGLFLVLQGSGFPQNKK